LILVIAAQESCQARTGHFDGRQLLESYGVAWRNAGMLLP